MKARRGLQITVGVLSIFTIALAVLAAVSIVVTHQLAPDSDATFFQNVNQGISAVNNWLKLGLRDSLIALLLAPVLVLTLATILLLIKNKGADSKNIAGCVLALVGSVILYCFGICVGFCMATKYAMAVIGPSAGLLALTILFVGLALGIGRPKKKKQTDTEDDEVQTDDTAADQTSEAVTPESEQLPTTDATPIEAVTEQPAETLTTGEQEATTIEPVGDYSASDTEQTPQTQDVWQTSESVDFKSVESVRETAEDIYESRQSKPATNHKLATLKMLLDSGAISEEEYEKLLEQYTK